jgi:carbamoyltransferase
MSVILGLHFGHDASVAVLVDGRLAAFIQRERLCRIKHAYSLDRATVERALYKAGVAIEAVDVVAATSTQGSEPILSNFQGFSLAYDASMAFGPPALLVKSIGADPAAVERLCAPSMVKRVLCPPRDQRTHPAFQHYFAEYSHIPFHELRRFPWLEAHVGKSDWHEPHGLDALAHIDVEDCVSDERCQFGFHYPLRVMIDGRTIPGVRVDHHLAHAASSYYRSGARQALILTNDGYGGRRTPFSNGGIYFGSENHLTALAPHFLTHGNLYDRVARSIGLSPIGASGKLMGLAPYGLPEYYDRRFVGDVSDLSRAGINGSSEAWIEFARERCRALGHREGGVISKHLPFSEFQVNLAASTQTLFEESWLAMVAVARTMLTTQNIQVDALCLSGGAALNCPSNSRVSREGGFPRLFVEPNCDDGGLSIGAALWVHHALLDNELKRETPFSAAEVYGEGYSREQIFEVVSTSGGDLQVEEVSNPAKAAAFDLAAGRVVGWFEGGAEMGPRALGHRSVLADPRQSAMSHRVNQAKGREQWRPFAPAVLEECVRRYFDLSAVSKNSPFMLLTTRVLDPSLAAVTHVDGSARVQTVTPENGGFHSLLCAFEELTGIPVLLNTSMNGPGEPMVETPEQAITFLRRNGADVIYLEGFRLTCDQGSSTISPS